MNTLRYDTRAELTRKLQEWVRQRIAEGHPAREVCDTIEQQAETIRQEREGQK